MHLEDNNLHEQHGVRCNLSCLTNLLETFEEWTLALDEGFGMMWYSWITKQGTSI